MFDLLRINAKLPHVPLYRVTPSHMIFKDFVFIPDTITTNRMCILPEARETHLSTFQVTYDLGKLLVMLFIKQSIFQPWELRRNYAIR